MFHNTVGTKYTVPKFPLPHQAPLIAATTFIEGITDVLQVRILLATLVWTIVNIANALKGFHGEE